MKPIAPLLVALLLSCALAAEDGESWPTADGLGLEVRPLVLNPRPDAPWWLETTLAESDGRLRAGRLSLTVLCNHVPLLRWISEELAVTGRRRSLVVLPPMPAISSGELSIACAWTAADGRSWDLGKRPLGGETRPAPVLGMIAEGHSDWGRLLPPAAAGQDRPERGPRRTSRRPQAMRIPLDLLPHQPLAWCACDAVLVAPSEAALLRGPEAEALAGWVRLGGRLALFEPPPPGSALAALLPVPSGPVTAYGLGLVVVASSDDECAVAQRALWAEPVDAEPVDAEMCFPPPSLHDDLSALLWPDQVATVPITVLMAIAGLFVLAIGPGEWFVLGWLRRRRWTWFTFPLLAAAATAATVLMARYYLGSGSYARTLAIVDVDAEGRSQRTTAITLHFRGEAGAVAIEGRGLLASACSGNGRRGRSYGPLPSDVQLPLAAEGQAPGHWVASVPIPQWSPVIVRTLAPGGEPAPRLARRQGHEDDLLRAAREADPGAEAVVVGPDPEHAYGDGGAMPVRLTHAAAGRTLAPTGGAGLSDLALIAAHDPDARVVLLIRRHGQDFTVFRYPCRTMP